MAQPTIAQLAKAVNELANSLAETRAEVTQLRSELQVLRNQAPNPINLEPRPAPITPFSGDPRQGKGFLAQCEVTFALQPSRFLSEASRVGFLASAFTSRALEWYTAVATRSPNICQSYNLFREQFLAVFSLPEDGEDAAIRLNRMVQGDRSVSDFAVDFRVLAAQCNVTDDSMRGTFYAGLNQDIKEGLVNQYPKSFAELVQLAIHVDIRHSDLASNRRRIRPTPPQFPLVSFQEPMELGATRVLSDEQRRERFEKGLCLYCGKGGHGRENCPKLAKKKQTH